MQVSTPQPARFQPSIRDLRSSFAVHRISNWYRSGANLSRLLPALAAYLGLTNLASIERYLEFTPERFRGALKVLSRNNRVLEGHRTKK